MSDVFGRDGNRPTVACDTVVLSIVNGVLSVLLVVRGHDPYKGLYALPGGFMEWGESCEEAARRELREETGINVDGIELIGVYSEPGRDPRGTVVSIEYLAVIPVDMANAVAGDDASEVHWVDVEKVPELAFDHSKVFADAMKLFAGSQILKSRLGL